jgi:transposase
MSGKIFLAPHHSTEELEHRYKAAADGVERSHVQIIWLLSQGHAAKFVAEVTGYSSVWISKILWRYNDHGLAGLGDGRQDNPGAAPLLNDAQLEELRAVVSDPPPDGGLWTGRKVAQWISGRIGRLVSPQRGVEYLRRLDLTRQVPRPCNPKQSLYEQARFKKNLQARVSELLGAETTGPIEVWAFDEHRLGLKPILRKVWAPRGCRPVAPGHHRFQWLYLYGFVRPATGQVVWFIADGVNTALFNAFLVSFAAEVGAGPNKHVILVLDGAGWHVSKDLEVPEGVELMFLPPYSPEIQPAERR